MGIATEPPIHAMFERRHKKKKTPGSGATSRREPDSTSAIEQMVVEEIEISAVGAGVGPGEREQRRVARRSAWLRSWLSMQRAASITALALLAVVATLATRSFWPVDETRFLGIAWEMWAAGDRLVPRLNGVAEPVAPLFFWLGHAGWMAFGVNDWWPRLIPGLLMVASLFVTARMARLLWPGGEEPWHRRVPYVMLGGFYWTASATLFTPDFLTTLFVLLALHALLWMWRKRDQRVWMLLGLWLGLGLLAGGSLALLYVLPVALVAPLWTRGTPTMPWKYWYVDIFKALLVGMVLFALWLIPAVSRAKAGGMTLPLTPMLVSPFATHALDMYDGARPWWWLLALLPVLGFPWSLWPLPWMRFWHIRREPTTAGLAFCTAWGVVTLALFLLSPVRQPQLLLPLVPAFFLVMAWLVLDERHEGHDHSHLASTMIFPLLLLGGALAVLPKLPHVDYLPEYLWQLSPFVGVGIIVVGIVVGFLPLPSLEMRVTNMAVMVVALSTLALLALGWQFNEHYDPSGTAVVIARAQQQGQDVAHVGPYRGQFHFSGQLRKPLAVVQPDAVETWMATHPSGLVVATSDNWQPRSAVPARPVHDQPYAGRRLRVWSVAELTTMPAVVPTTPGAPPAAATP